MTAESGEEDKPEPKTAIHRRRRYTAEIDHLGASNQTGALIELDENGFITIWSNEAEQLYGYEQEEAIGKHVASLYCGGELEQGRAAYELNAIKTRRNYKVFGWQLRKSGQQFWTYTESEKTDQGFRLNVSETPQVDKA